MFDSCFSPHEATMLIGASSLGLLVTVLIPGSMFEGYPYPECGVRPKGRGLFSYNIGYYLEGKGCWGYDPILGAYAPPLRLRMHVVAWMVLWCLVQCVWPSGSSSILPRDKCLPTIPLPLSVAQSCAVSLMGYLFVMFVFHHVLPGVSHPGGPREQRIQRQPKWPDELHESPAVAVQHWKCIVAEESHKVSTETFKDSVAQLTGEPFGRQTWTFDENKDVSSGDEKLIQKLASGGRESGFNPSVNPNSCDMIFRAQQIRKYISSGKSPPDSTSKAQTVKEAIRKGAHFYSMLQTDDGHWAGDYGGPHFLMPGVIVSWYVMGKPSQILDEKAIELMKHYIFVHQQVDGGWGTHIESPSTMFGTVLMYVALRLLGVPADNPAAEKGRSFIRQHGGATMTSSWSKFYLCLLGCMEWEGHNSVPPEMWLLPNWFPFHPGRMWCHARMVYLPMGYLYGRRYVFKHAKTDPTVTSLRKELYCESYESIPWDKTRHSVAALDNYSPIPWIMEFSQNALACYERWPIFQPFKNWIRKYGLAFSVSYMHVEDLQTNYIDIGPVNKVLNMISAYADAGESLEDSNVANHMIRVADYLWVAEDGMKMQGYNGSQCWDTSFAIQALYEGQVLDEFPETSQKAWAYLERCQILSTETSQATVAYEYESPENRMKFYRHVSEGGWPFSTSAHGWPISDCTSEGLKGVLCLLRSKAVKEGVKDGGLKPIDETRLEKAVNVMLTYQNEDGGWATYENNRGWGWYEQLNPSEVFGDIMIDYSYVECSMACLTALAEFHHDYPKHRQAEVIESLQKGRDFLKSIQRENGSWYGSWACCFCYGTWFGVEGLVKSGEPLDSPRLKKACEFLLKHQRPNGGWGEDFTSCYDKDYAENGMDAYGDEGSGVVNTGWALLALSCAKCDDVAAVRRGVKYLMKRQLPCGDWEQEGIAGVFNRSVGITYTAYRNVFPLWAMGRCYSVYGDALDEES